MEHRVNGFSTIGLTLKIVVCLSFILLDYANLVKGSVSLSESEKTEINQSVPSIKEIDHSSVIQEDAGTERQARQMKLYSSRYSTSAKILGNKQLQQTLRREDDDIQDNVITEDHEDTATSASPFAIWTTLLSSAKHVIEDCGQISHAANEDEAKGVLKCLKKSTIRHISPMLHSNGSRISVFNGTLEIERDDGVNFTLGSRHDFRVGRDDKDASEVEEEEDEELKRPQEYIEEFERLSKKITIRVKLMPGLILRMARREDGFKIGMELDEKDFEDLQGRGGTRKKLKKLKKFLPLLLIPIAIQFILLPMVLATLKMMATKALLAGKLALLLVIFNGIWGALVPQHEEYNTRVAHDFYGYDGNLEYGAYVNRRMERDRSILKQDLPYRGHR